MTLPIVFHPDYMAPLRRGHPFPMSKYGYLREALVARRLLPPAGGFLSPAPASVARVAAVHALPYVERVANQTLAPAEARAIGLPNTAAVARRAFLAAAGTLLAARLALEHGVACNMAGGSHHAGPEGGAGYCVFNDVAVAAQALLDEGVVARVLVVDCDVHQGDGTARIFAGRADVLTLSLHAERNYPARKARSHLDFPLPDRLGDRAYLEVLAHALGARRALPPADRLLQRRRRPARRRPPRAASPSATRACAPATRLVAGWARRRRLPLVGVLGGGYDNDPRATRGAPRHPLRGGGPRRRLRTGKGPPMGKGELASDPRGLILEAYRMEIGAEDCRTIFLDWALGQPGAGPAEIAELLAHYGARQPDHPMTAILRAAADAPPAPARRGGRRGRRQA